MSGKLSEKLSSSALAYALLGETELPALLREAAAAVRAVEDAPEAVMDTRDVLGICAPAEEDFPALYAMQGKRVRLVEVV